ncbi:hypothetical protein SOMG_02576 [Schizosaccharomyces osmophilus]|uniref:Uncharacterized protein n=1 Tax=Schizosaccharomyces osmophilus TaxID=2545709 RepID=A0AAE9WEA8_9SCHI|nr:uncharacterized protein SOMG_02576 [Schizosaccharomyces osmophilus]WBW73163.1 hypothetical protein SOMG_02576 [Schizosaccharomyces osmophilus]
MRNLKHELRDIRNLQCYARTNQNDENFVCLYGKSKYVREADIAQMRCDVTQFYQYVASVSLLRLENLILSRVTLSSENPVYEMVERPLDMNNDSNGVLL